MGQFETYLSVEDQDKIVEAFDEADIKYDSNKRGILLYGIDKTYINNNLPEIGAVLPEKLRNDLMRLSRIKRLSDGSVPLWRWLTNAEREFDSLVQQNTINNLLKKVPQKVEYEPDSDDIYKESKTTNKEEPITNRKRNANLKEELLRLFFVVIATVLIVIFLQHLAKRGIIFSPAGISDAEIPVVVLDISGVKPNRNGATPTDKLEEIIEALITSGAKAIAVDIDFSPRTDPSTDPQNQDSDPLRDEDDDEFFEFLITQREEKGVPIYVGAYRNVNPEPASWLGYLDYKDLAAYIASFKDTSKVPAWFQCEGYPRLNSISQALTIDYGKKPRTLDSLQGFVKVHDGGEKKQVEKINENEKRVTCQIAFTRVNYSKLGQIQNELTIPATIGKTVLDSHSRFRDKLVIIGYSRRDRATDSVNVKGFDEPVFGIFLHAAATYTQTSAPFYEFRRPFVIVLDCFLIVFFLIGIATIYFLKTKYKNHTLDIFGDIFIGAFIVATFVLGLILVKIYNILWFDYQWVWFALLLISGIRNIFGYLTAKTFWKEMRGQ